MERFDDSNNRQLGLEPPVSSDHYLFSFLKYALVTFAHRLKIFWYKNK